MKTSYPLVAIEWEDAYDGNHDWFKANTMPEEVEPLMVYTTGFLVREHPDRITVTQSFSHDSLANLWTIPKAMIKKITYYKIYRLERGEEID